MPLSAAFPLILLVEDDPDDEELARIALEQAGIPHALAVARDGAEALEWLHRTGRYAGLGREVWPRLVLLDLKLPKVTGLEVLASVRRDERTKILPVAVFTSSGEEEDLQRCYRLGANAYLRKPVDFGEYASLVGVTAAFWIERNQLPSRHGMGAS